MRLDGQSIFEPSRKDLLGVKGEQVACRQGWAGRGDSSGFMVWISRISATVKPCERMRLRQTDQSLPKDNKGLKPAFRNYYFPK